MILREPCHLAIVGGSFSGLACAQAAAARGLETVVLERKKEVGRGVRTTGILVKEVADQLDIPSALLRRIEGVKIWLPQGKSIELARRGYAFFATDTPAVLRWMEARALAVGAEVRCGETVIRGQQDSKGVRLETRHGKLRAQLLMGADGERSSVAKFFGLSSNRRHLLGVEVELQGVRGVDPRFLHVFVDQKLAPGYIGWVVPGVGQVCQVGLASQSGRPPKWQPFWETVGEVFDLREAEEVGRRGGRIPCGGPLRRRFAGRVCLLGDAAGLVSPLTGGGIHPAIEIGRRAGILAADHLEGRGALPGERLQKEVPHFRFKGLLRWAWDQMERPGFPLLSFLESSLGRRLAQVIFFHHRGLLSAEAWKDLFDPHFDAVKRLQESHNY
ncbi:MAG: NAD(P)/FAD-dependent oxidoreductase [Verrucomicrobiota bacterium]